MKNNLPDTARLKGIRPGMAHNGEAKAWLDGKSLSHSKSLKHVSHSPTGFNWGYGGSGPAQLAYAICHELYGASTARQVYQDFKWRFLVAIEGDSFDLALDLKEFNASHVLPLLEPESDSDLYEPGNGPTGHGETCYSDADPGL